MRDVHINKTKSSAIAEEGYSASADQLEKYRLLVESIQDYAIFLLDTEGRVASWNPGAKKLKGYEKAEIIGKNFSIFFPKEEVRKGKPTLELKEARENGRAEYEGWRIRKDGSRFWANVIITALYDNEGVLQGYAKVTRDLTERKQMEDQLAKANIELEHQREELTLLNQAKDDFISLASHQLRTPATGVKQYLGLLMQGFVGDVPGKQLSMLKKAFASNERQIQLINDLLRVAQIDAGKIILKKSPTDLTTLVIDVVAEQKDSFEKRGQEVTIKTSTPIIVDLDVRRFRMVLDNLIDNASKYTPSNGKIKVTLSVKGSNLKISVADTGVGIKAEDISKLFTKFSRVNNELSDKAGGSGLGLYWASKVVQMHGGRIEVRSTPQEGSEFTVTIPMEDSNG